MAKTKTAYQHIIDSVGEELKGFEQDTLQLTKQEIFDKHTEISFYSELHCYMCDTMSSDFDEDELTILVGRPDILFRLWQMYDEDPNQYSFRSFEDDRELVEALIANLNEEA